MKTGRLLLIVVALLAIGGTARAEDAAHERARAAFKAGSNHYNLGEFQQALDAFREAYRAYDDPSLLFNIAQCERQLGHKREAVREYHAYLNNAPADAPNRDAVRQIITQLEKEIADEQNTAKMPPTTVLPSPAAGTTPATPPAAHAATTSATTLTATAPARQDRPAYKKWWVWTLVGGVVLAGAATGLAIGLSSKSAPTATTTLGTQSPF